MVGMVYYIQGMVKYFPYEVKTTTIAPWNESLFKVDKRSKRLDEERRGVFHTFFMKCMFFLQERTSRYSSWSWIHVLTSEVNKQERLEQNIEVDGIP